MALGQNFGEDAWIISYFCTKVIMRTIVSAFLIIFLASFVYGQSAPKKGLKFDKIEITRPDIPYGSNELFIFAFKNRSKKPVTIAAVQTSCGCTTAEKPKEPIGSKKTGRISVSYDTKRVGEFVKSITVTPEGMEPIVLTIRGNVLPEKQ